jgi:hypothetical protein
MPAIRGRFPRITWGGHVRALDAMASVRTAVRRYGRRDARYLGRGENLGNAN